MTMQLLELTQKIIALLQSLGPEKVILFGSYAWGNPSADSDVDLYIVTRDSSMPATYYERSELNLRYARAIAELSGLIPVDLIVHTRPMHEKFLEIDSMFSRKILSSGISLV